MDQSTKTVKIGVVFFKTALGGTLWIQFLPKSNHGQHINILNNILKFEISTFKTVAGIVFTDAHADADTADVGYTNRVMENGLNARCLPGGRRHNKYD